MDILKIASYITEDPDIMDEGFFGRKKLKQKEDEFKADRILFVNSLGQAQDAIMLGRPLKAKSLINSMLSRIPDIPNLKEIRDKLSLIINVLDRPPYTRSELKILKDILSSVSLKISWYGKP